MVVADHGGIEVSVGSSARRRNPTLIRSPCSQWRNTSGTEPWRARFHTTVRRRSTAAAHRPRGNGARLVDQGDAGRRVSRGLQAVDDTPMPTKQTSNRPACGAATVINSVGVCGRAVVAMNTPLERSPVLPVTCWSSHCTGRDRADLVPANERVVARVVTVRIRREGAAGSRTPPTGSPQRSGCARRNAGTTSSTVTMVRPAAKAASSARR